MIDNKNKQKTKPKDRIVLDKEEQKIEESLIKDEYESAKDTKETKKLFREAARNYRQLTKSKRITIRVNQEDLISVKAKAKKSGIPYQTLLKTLIRQYVRGRTQIEL